MIFKVAKHLMTLELERKLFLKSTPTYLLNIDTGLGQTNFLGARSLISPQREKYEYQVVFMLKMIVLYLFRYVIYLYRFAIASRVSWCHASVFLPLCIIFVLVWNLWLAVPRTLVGNIPDLTEVPGH